MFMGKLVLEKPGLRLVIVDGFQGKQTVMADSAIPLWPIPFHEIQQLRREVKAVQPFLNMLGSEPGVSCFFS